VANRFVGVAFLSSVRRMLVVAIACLPASSMALNASVDSLRRGIDAKPPVTAPVSKAAKSGSSGHPRVAVIPFSGEDIAPEKLAEATKRFESRLSSTDSFWIAPDRKVGELLRQRHAADSADCQTGDCSLEIARQLGAESIFTGVVSQEVETWRLEVVRTDVESGKVVFDHLIEIYGSFADLVSQGCPRMALLACGRESSDNNYTVLEGTGGGHTWPWILGGIAVAAGGATAAVLLLQDKGSTTSNPAPAADQLIVKW
jgi:hypothetical protein